MTAPRGRTHPLPHAIFCGALRGSRTPTFVLKGGTIVLVQGIDLRIRLPGDLLQPPELLLLVDRQIACHRLRIDARAPRSSHTIAPAR